MLQTLIRRSGAAAVKFDINKNPFKAKRHWPPDFDQLSQKHQFRLERRYRRRAKLAWARPRWTKFVKLATWGSIAFVVVYGVLFMDTDERGSPFDSVLSPERTGGMQDLLTSGIRFAIESPKAPEEEE
ncbi:hypothetical protein MBLNU459_g0853t2 [Dothideomycetes sp. NU459]